MLRSYGLITTHARGLPGNLAASGGQYWRLTTRGLDLFVETFQREHEPENLINRTKRASLRCFEHRDEMTETYLRLIYSQDQDIDEITSRADSLDWLGEYEVQLKVTEMGAGPRCRVVPDATLKANGQRLFLEVDRSTESHTRCKRTMKRYASSIRFGHYRKRFPDNLPALVVYITTSERRARGLQKLMDGLVGLPYRGIAMTSKQATEWLRDQTSSLPAETPNSGREELDSVCLLLRELYKEYRDFVADELAKGITMAPPKAMMEAYAYLQGRQAEVQH